MASAVPLSGQLQLKHELNGVQVLSIVLSAVIGSGLFSGNNEALAVAGPAGLILAVLILGAIAAMVAETVSQLVQLFPAPNAVYEYVYAFVDEELAWVVGLAYWYCFTAVFATQMLSAAKLLFLWQVESGLDLTPTGGLPVWLFYSFIPFLLFLINLMGVKAFGWVETFGGLTKSLVVITLTAMLYGIAIALRHRANPIGDAFRGDPLYSQNWWEGLCIAFPGVAFGYIGIESTIMAAFEADPRENEQTLFGNSLKRLDWASRWVHWIVVLLYLFYTIGVALTVPWNNINLAPTYGLAPKYKLVGQKLQSSNSVIIAMSSWHGTDTPAGRGIVNSLLIFCILSSANTSLYIASRTLWGLSRYSMVETPVVEKMLKKLSGVWQPTAVPLVSLLWSLLAFLSWFPATQFSPAAEKVAYILSSTASVSCLVVWAALCLAFINYHRNSQKEDNMKQLTAMNLGSYIADSRDYGKKTRRVIEAERHGRDNHETGPQQNVEALRIRNTFNPSFRLTCGLPVGATLGLLGCLCVFGFALGDRWDNQSDSVVKSVAAYGTHVICLSTFGIMKLWRLFQGKHLFKRNTSLAERIDILQDKCIKSHKRHEAERNLPEGRDAANAVVRTSVAQEPLLSPRQ